MLTYTVIVLNILFVFLIYCLIRVSIFKYVLDHTNSIYWCAKYYAKREDKSIWKKYMTVLNASEVLELTPTEYIDEILKNNIGKYKDKVCHYNGAFWINKTVLMSYGSVCNLLYEQLCSIKFGHVPNKQKFNDDVSKILSSRSAKIKQLARKRYEILDKWQTDIEYSEYVHNKKNVTLTEIKKVNEKLSKNTEIYKAALDEIELKLEAI